MIKLRCSSNNVKKCEEDSPSVHFDVIPSQASAATMAPNWKENDNPTEVAWKLTTMMQYPLTCTEARKNSP